MKMPKIMLPFLLLGGLLLVAVPGCGPAEEEPRQPTPGYGEPAEPGLYEERQPDEEQPAAPTPGYGF